MIDNERMNSITQETPSVLKRFYFDRDLLRRQQINEGRARIIADTVRAKTGLEFKNRKILEFGCNLGFAIAEFARMGNDCVGADLLQEAINIAQKRDAGIPRLQYIKIDGTLPFPDNSFDFVFSSEVLEHVPLDQRKTYFQEFCRVLKPNGIGYMSYPNFLFPLEQHYFIPFHHWVQRVFPRPGLIYEDIPSKMKARQMMDPYFTYQDIGPDFLTHPELRKQRNPLFIFGARCLSNTPFSIQDYLLLKPKK